MLFPVKPLHPKNRSNASGTSMRSRLVDKQVHPGKLTRNHHGTQNGCLGADVPFQFFGIFRFQPLIFRGVSNTILSRSQYLHDPNDKSPSQTKLWNNPQNCGETWRRFLMNLGIITIDYRYTLPETNSSQLKIDGLEDDPILLGHFVDLFSDVNSLFVSGRVAFFYLLFIDPSWSNFKTQCDH